MKRPDWRILMVVLLLFGILTYLFGQSRTMQPQLHTNALSDIHEMDAIDVQLDRDVLLARIGLLRNYDQINDWVDALREDVNYLHSNQSAVYGMDPTVDEHIDILGREVSRKEDLLDRFKMDNTILRNSVLYYTVLTHDLCEQAAVPRKQTGPVAIANDLSHHILQYLQEPKSSAREDVAIRLDQLAAQTQNTPSREVQRLYQHGTVIYNRASLVDETMRMLTDRQLGGSITTLENAYLDWYSRNQMRSQKFLNLLYAASLLLLLYLSMMFYRMQHKERQLAESNSVCAREMETRKSAQRALQESEIKYRLLLESTGEGIYGVDLEGRCTFINPAALRMLGIEREDGVLGKNMHALIHHTRPDGSPYPGRECRVYQAFRRGEGVHVDDEVLWKTDGTSFPAEYQSYPMYPDGSPVGAVVTFTDISERKRTEKALLDSQAQLADAQRIAHVGNWSLNLRTNELTGSNETYHVFGIEPPPDKLTFETLLSYVKPEDRIKLQETVNLALQQQTSFDIIYNIVRMDGTERIIHSQGDVSVDEKGEPLWLVGTVQDVTGPKRAEEAQRRYAERLRILNDIHRAIRLARSPAAIASVALKHIEQLIPSVRSSVITFDFSDNTVAVLAAEGRGLDEYGPGTPLPMQWLEPQLKSLRHGRSYEIHDTRKAPELHEGLRPFIKKGLRSLVNVPLLVEGELIGSLNLARDRAAAFDDEHLKIAREIADSLAIAIQQARLHEQIRHHAEELEATVAKRTASLVTANKELQTFSYSVSHDLRAPLRSIDGFSLALIEDYDANLDDRGRHYLERIRTATQHMAQLIDDLLSLAKVTRSDMKSQPVNLSRLAREITAALQRSDETRKVEFVIQDGLEILGDPRLLRVMLENVMGNAWKFTSHHETARIEFGGKLQDNEHVFYVIDNGAGFDETYADKLFNPFQRLHTPEEFEGTGIGLATVKRIVERHGGRIWAKGEVEKGARIYFALPVKGAK